MWLILAKLSSHRQRSWIENLVFLVTQECSVCFLHSKFACCAHMKVNRSAHLLRMFIFLFFHNCILLFKALASHSVEGLFKPHCGTCFCFNICFSLMSLEAWLFDLLTTVYFLLLTLSVSQWFFVGLWICELQFCLFPQS